jgi:hypothetical protein
MPRTRKPGPRQNRSDLPSAAASAVQPPRLATGQGYGERAASAELQSIAPMADRSTEAMLAAGSTGGAGPVAPAPPPGAPTNPLEEFIAAAQMAQPGGEGLFAGETARPDEPVTAGLDVGMGPGSDAVAPLATSGPDPSIVLWAQRMPALGLLVSMPGSSPQLRQFYRRLRSQLPPGYYENAET